MSLDDLYDLRMDSRLGFMLKGREQVLTSWSVIM